MRKAKEVIVNRHAADAARRGHPWIWKQAVLSGASTVTPGEEVQIVEGDGAAVGRAIADPSSPIFARVWTKGDAPIDAGLIRSRMDRAFEIRQRLFADGRTSAYRLLNGEGDRCPGFVIDRYGDFAVVRTDGEAASALLSRGPIVGQIVDALAKLGVTSLSHRIGAKERDSESSNATGAAKEKKGSGGALWVTLHGPPAPPTVRVVEHGVPFAVDLARGQKTGAFLDQRENRRRVGELAPNRRVLNLFSYAGGFSLHAALGGATHVTSVDVAANAHATAQQSFSLAGIDAQKHSFVTADVFSFLADAKRRGERWDLIVSDPPSFAPSERALPRALSAYRALHRACVDVLSAGGTFCAASCSSHVDAVAFSSTLDDAAIGTDALRLLELFGSPSDHPTVAGWPEGRYLKFAVLA